MPNAKSIKHKMQAMKQERKKGGGRRRAKEAKQRKRELHAGPCWERPEDEPENPVFAQYRKMGEKKPVGAIRFLMAKVHSPVTLLLIDTPYSLLKS
jgi:ribosomal protein S8E